MSQLLLFALLGLGLGSLIAGIGLAIVVAFRGSGVVPIWRRARSPCWAPTSSTTCGRPGSLLLPPIPFAPHRLSLGDPWPTLPAMLAALAVCAVTGALFDILVLRRLRTASPLARLLASLGLLITIQAVAVLRYGTSGQAAPAGLTDGVGGLDVGGAVVPTNRFLLAGIVLAATVVLWALYRFTRFGLAHPRRRGRTTKAMLAGLPPDELSLANTVLAALIAGSLGVLAAPMEQSSTPTTIPLAVVPALGAALLARFTSFGLVALCGN